MILVINIINLLSLVENLLSNFTNSFNLHQTYSPSLSFRRKEKSPQLAP